MKFNMERNAVLVILEGVAAAVVLNLYNPFVQIFAKRLGASDIHVALLNSLPQLVAIAVLLPCSFVIERVRDKKFAACIMILFLSVFYGLIAFVPLMPAGLRVNIFVLLIGLMNWPGSLYVSTWQSFFSYTFSGDSAARVYSLRGKYSAFSGVVAALLAGFLISNTCGRLNILAVYQIIYAACFIIALSQVVLLVNVRPCKPDLYGDKALKFRICDFKAIIYDKKFITYCFALFVFHVGWQAGWPIFFLYQTDIMKLNEFQLALISVFVGLMQFIAYSWWHRLSIRRSNEIVMFLGAAGLVINPYLYVVTSNFYVVLVVAGLIGIPLAGVNYSIFAGLMELLPDNLKTVYISFFNTVLYVSGFLTPLVIVFVYHRIGMVSTLHVIGFARILAAVVLFLRWFLYRWNLKLKHV